MIDIDDKGYLFVTAHIIDKIHIHYICPFCVKKYKKSGDPRRGAKPLKHVHGSNGDLSNRIEHRIMHCFGDGENFREKYYPNCNGTVYIKIIDDTLRKAKPNKILNL